MNTIVREFLDYEGFKIAMDAAEALGLDYAVKKETATYTPTMGRTLLPVRTTWTLELIFTPTNIPKAVKINTDDEQK